MGELNSEGWGHSVSAASLEYLHAINSNGSDDMFFLDWPCLGSVASAGGACGPWS